MREIALFVEDRAHELVVGALTRRLAVEIGREVKLVWRSARRGHGRALQEYREFLRDLRRQPGQRPDLIIVATDANCQGLSRRAKAFEAEAGDLSVVHAIPDPHIERWLLLDGAAFKTVFGKGCDAPDQKCDRDRYKELLIRAIMAAGLTPSLGGIEFAEDIVAAMDIDRVARADRSMKRFIDDLSQAMRTWA